MNTTVAQEAGADGDPSPAVGSEPLVSARDLSVGYGDEPVCAPATFDLRAGQVLALVGVNGAGKSTMLRTCCGLLHPLEGEVRVLGHVPDPRSGPQRAALATDLGQESFFPTLTVAEHLRLVCFGHGVAEADEVVGDLLEDLELTRLAGHLPEELSSGQRRRLALASVLARPRRLLVLDEPEQRLDRVTRLLLADRLIEERDSGGGVLMVSHDPEIVEEAATQVLLVGRDTRMLSVADGVRAIEQGLQ
ncbi:ABC transporter ATP-binding protein [Actinomyces sp. ZJ308]|uniref:ABC transporter ATP-binding protein n=1 Tax=Actinomyces sp. ZJ308 TaxID=2708342 RepID=UPI001FB92E50|nr:ABC transporter ATP-binding protein [Actinomyces sp. ZJ308]